MDFDEWVTLYKDDPEAFEKKRVVALEQAIYDMTDDTVTQNRLKAVVFAENKALDKFVDPIARFNEVQRRFYNSLTNFTKTLTNPEVKESATILDFKTQDPK